MTHIQNETTKLVEEWKQHGFNGVSFIECYMEQTKWEDWESDGRTREEFDKFVENYAIFIAHPDLYNIFFEQTNKYESVQIDWSKFEKDIKAEIKRRLGDDIKIKHNRNCHEYEIEKN